MAHRNARTTVYARRLIVERHAAGWPAARIAEQLGISRATVHKWIARHRAEGLAGLADRPSRPRTMPGRTPAAVEAAVLAARVELRRGAVYLAGELGLVASTVGRILARHGVAPLAAVDPITGEPVRRRHTGLRYERHQPGDLLHVDVKKLMSRNSAGSPTAAGGACTAARTTPNANATAAAGSATTTSTSPSTTGPGWPTSKPCPTSAT